MNGFQSLEGQIDENPTHKECSILCNAETKFTQKASKFTSNFLLFGLLVPSVDTPAKRSIFLWV